MKSYDHLPLRPLDGEFNRKKLGGGGGYQIPEGRDKRKYIDETLDKAKSIISSHEIIKNKFQGIVNPSLIFELEINQSVNFKTIKNELSKMDIHILSTAENKKGYWVVFSDEEDLKKFNEKLSTYGSPDGPKLDFFYAFGELRDIPREDKIGEKIKQSTFNK